MTSQITWAVVYLGFYVSVGPALPVPKIRGWPTLCSRSFFPLSGALSNHEHGLFYPRYFENRPLEPGQGGPSLKLKLVGTFALSHSVPSLL